MKYTILDFLESLYEIYDDFEFCRMIVDDDKKRQLKEYIEELKSPYMEQFKQEIKLDK